MSVDQRPRGEAGRVARAGTLLITWATKIVGLVSATNQLLLHGDHPSSVALAVSAFMIGGAQVSEGLILGIIDRVMANSRPEPHKPDDERASPRKGRSR